jgi:hypothetical protein
MKNVLILSETIYKGRHKLVNQGSFVNFSDLINDIFACDGLTCACNGNNLQKSDIFIRKSALIYSRKKPGANWTSLEKIVKDVYNCCAGTSLCPGKKNQWWITTDVIRPRKTVETINFTNIIIKALTCCELLDCCAPVSSPYNFDITADWSLVGSTPVTNQASFEDWLINDLGATSVVITSFDLTGNRLKADIIVNGVGVLNLTNKNVTLVEKIGGFNSSLTQIRLNDNNIVTFNPSIPLPASVTQLRLQNNQIVTFSPSIALPNSLQSLVLDNNQIVTFNPTIALPNSLQYLYLINNQIITFNPTIALPTNLLELRLDNNNIVTFNPSIILPTGLSNLGLSSNQMTTAGYTSSEPWANAQPAFSPNCSTFFPGNSNSITGTNLETILLTKNCTIIP